MCGRYVLALSAVDLEDGFSHLKLNPLAGLAGLDALDLRPRYNIAPSTQVLVVRRQRGAVANADGGREGQGDRLVAETMRWGLLPGWLKDAAQAKGWSNARAETVATNGVFKNAFKRWRCIVPAQGFYEWQTLPAPAAAHQAARAGKPLKLPHYIYPTGERFFGFAGLCERWVSPAGEIVHSVCVITTEPNALMARIHDRMPVILDRADWADWLDPRQTDVTHLQRYLRPYPAERMAAHPVGTAVSHARNEGATLIVALSEAQYRALAEPAAAPLAPATGAPPAAAVPMSPAEPATRARAPEVAAAASAAPAPAPTAPAHAPAAPGSAPSTVTLKPTPPATSPQAAAAAPSGVNASFDF